jgi:hypothetical protein
MTTALLLAGAIAATSGTWTASVDGNDVHLGIHPRGEGGSQFGNQFRRDELRGFTGKDGEARFSLVRDAGTIEFEGTFRNGEGAGFFQLTQAPGFVETMSKLGYPQVRSEGALLLTLIDIGPKRVREYQELGFRHLSWDDFQAFCLHGVTAGWVKALRALGLSMTDPEKVEAMRIHDVTPAWVREVRDAGLGGADEESLIGLRIHDVTADYAREMRSLGLGDLDAEKLQELRIHDVTPEYVRRMRAQGFTKASADDFVQLKISGVEEKMDGSRHRKKHQRDGD